MNKSLFMGIALGMVCTVIGIAIAGGGFDLGKIQDYIDPPSIMIVVGGTLGAIIASFPMDDLKKIPQLIKLAMTTTPSDYSEQIQEIVTMAETARKKGILALEEKLNDIKDPFIKNGIMLVMDGTDPELVKSMLETQSYFTDDRHAKYISIFEVGSSCAPAFGMIGTLIGLINMLQNLTADTSSIGPNMAVALVTTFYGVMLANLVFNPIASQLRARNAQEQLCKDIIIEGVLSIQDGENPRVIEDKLKSFIAASEAGKAASAASAEGDDEGERA